MIPPSPAFSRRQFLQRTSLAGAALALLPALPAAIPAANDLLIGSQLYGWGQYYQKEGKNFADHLNEIFSALRDAGYHYAEGSVDVARPENNLLLADRLRRKGLKPVSLYTGGRLHEAGVAMENVQKIVNAAKSCREAGFTVINCNPDPIGRNKTEEELKVQALALQQLGKELRGLGLRLGIHHHTPEMQNEAKEFHGNFRNTTPEEVGFCYDVHWVYRGGLAPQAALKEYGSRIVSWHLRQSREGTWWEDLDKGDIDYQAVARFAREQRLPRLYTVELALERGTKITRSVVQNHQRSREFVSTLFA